ncbi:MATE family efflux transporter [Bacillus alkalicellulosilyticus]|uniref:MATE family efflux transporter n=1 Tax=Alkalihalobacterium alkalicellulosilyticum TaxID=1912214 RepID=UPI000998BFA6|nr:MATE family efflux transporter [Bacillus alkalicellulosilyticus]
MPEEQAKTKTNTVAKLSLFAITWPIFIEVFLQTLMKFSDVFMLSFVSDEAVAAIGVVNQVLMFMFVLFSFTAMGAGVVVAQYVGAKQPKAVSITAANAITINLLFGIFISVIVVVFRHPFLSLFNLDPTLLAYADIYMIIVGGTLFTQAMILTIFSILQATGATKDVMYVALGMNVLNILGNYVFIFGALGFPQLGVTGVAIATAVCRVLAVVALFWMFYRRIEVRVKFKDYIQLKKEYVKKIMGIGVPSAGEHLSYNTSQMTVLVFITMLGTTALATRIYAQNILMLMVVFSMSMSKGMQIYIGQLVGAGLLDLAYKKMYQGLKVALVVAVVFGTTLALTGEHLFRIFTDDPDVIALGAVILIIGALLEPGRTGNLVIISSLRATGDAKFPVFIGILSMWGISVPLAYVLGITLGFGLIGVWIAFMIDEWLRAIIMFFRWKSQKWRGKVLVKPTEEAKGA